MFICSYQHTRSKLTPSNIIMETISLGGTYTAPQLKVIELDSQGVLCASDATAGNGSYTEKNYPW